MSGNGASAIKTDRRITETRDLLGDALLLLMQEKAFDDITVQQVLDRAGVGRSTFYTHFRDKQDLFVSDVDEFFGGFSTLLDRTGAPPDRLAPVREFLAHLRDARGLMKAMMASGKYAEVMQLARGHFARGIERRLSAQTLDSVERKMRAHALAGSLFALIDWWVDHDMAAEPEVLDVLFHRTAWQGLSAP